jgi:hypothetical protein
MFTNTLMLIKNIQFHYKITSFIINFLHKNLITTNRLCNLQFFLLEMMLCMHLLREKKQVKNVGESDSIFQLKLWGQIEILNSFENSSEIVPLQKQLKLKQSMDLSMLKARGGGDWGKELLLLIVGSIQFIKTYTCK